MLSRFILYLDLKRCVINDIFRKLQFLSGLLDGIFPADAGVHQLLDTDCRIISSGSFLFLQWRTGDHQNKFTLRGLRGVFFDGLTQGAS